MDFEKLLWVFPVNLRYDAGICAGGPVNLAFPVNVATLADYGGGGLRSDAPGRREGLVARVENGQRRAQLLRERADSNRSDLLHHIQRNICFPLVHAPTDSVMEVR